MRAARKTEKSGEKEFFVAIRIFLAILCRLMSPAYVRTHCGGTVPDLGGTSTTTVGLSGPSNISSTRHWQFVFASIRSSERLQSVLGAIEGMLHATCGRSCLLSALWVIDL